MAVTKEAIAIVLDVGRCMHDETKYSSILQDAKNCITMIIQRKIFSESKDEIALILFGTLDTSNSFTEQGSSDYLNINVIQDLKPANWDLLGYVNDITGTDFPSEIIRENALSVAVDLLQNNVNGKKFFTRRILFLSRFDDMFSPSSMDRICEDLKAFKIDLNLIGPISASDETLTNQNVFQLDQKIYRNLDQGTTENAIWKILREVNGEAYTFSEALPALIYYQKKKVQPQPWNANLDIGTNLTIPISAYIKVNECKAKPWKNAYAEKLNAKIEKRVTYLMNDEYQMEVPKEHIVPAYKYGTTLVPFTEEDKMNMDYQSGEKGMKVLGFTKSENILRFHYIGDKSMYVFGQKNRELAGVILAPFIQALHDTNMVAIVRYVYSPRSAPKIGFLYPKIKPNYECLIFIALPFMEDMRHFIFTPLKQENTDFYPTDEQLNAVDGLITSMDLSAASVEDDGSVCESLKPKTTVNPYLQRLYQCLQHRAFHPDKPLPEIAPQIKDIINPLPNVLQKAEPYMQKIRTLFTLKECLPKAAQEPKLEIEDL
ncbi:X-ray repair cross-complementing protein 5, partial [Stegodyphus mimosarum]